MKKFKTQPHDYINETFTHRNGFKGVCTGVTYYVNGCVQLLIEPTTSDPSKNAEAHWFDEQGLTPETKKLPRTAWAGGGHPETRR